MRARLGFALVTSFSADLLILDEVLSVGDWAFQQRCLERIRDLNEGVTAIVFVSHSPLLTTQICERAILLDDGQIAAEGDPVSVMERYIGEGTVLDTEKDASFPVLPMLGKVDGASPVRISDLVLETREIEPHGRLHFRFHVQVDQPTEAVLVMSIYTLGRAVFSDPALGPLEVFEAEGGYTVSGRTDHLPFSPGGYKLRVAAIPAVDPEDFLQDFVDAYDVAAVEFKVVGEFGSRPGLQWTTEWWFDADAHAGRASDADSGVPEGSAERIIGR